MRTSVLEATTNRRAQEEEMRRIHILDVAEQLFAEQGLHNTSVADIARNAEFGVGTIYKYFKDKNTLIESLLRDRMSAHFEQINCALNKEGTPVEVIDGVIDAFFDSVKANERFFNIYFTHFHPGMGAPKQGYDGSVRLEFVTDYKKKMLKGMEQIFQKGILRGDFIDVESSYLANALFGTFIAFRFAMDFQTNDKEKLREMNQTMRRIFFHGISSRISQDQQMDEETR